VRITLAGKRRLFDPPSVAKQVTPAPVLGPREVMFPPFGTRTAVVHCTSVAADPFLVELQD
jgi:hypothetical protein